MASPCTVQPGFQYTSYPCGIDSSTQLPITIDNQTPVKAEVVNRHREAIIAIESELGVAPSGTFTTVRARLDALEALAGGGGGIGGISVVKKDDVAVVSNVTSLNFVGAAVNVADAGGNQANVTVVVNAEFTQIQETKPVNSNGQTAFTLTYVPLDDTALLMFVNGVKQEYGVDYTSSTGSVTYSGSISLITADIIEFWYISAGSVSQVQETIPVTSNGQTIFTLSSAPSNDVAVQMYVNGIKQEYGGDYAVAGTTVSYLGSVSMETTFIVEFWYIDAGGGGGGGGGSQTLAQTLSNGNISGGNDIILSSGDVIQGLAGAVEIDGGLVVNAEVSAPIVPTSTQGTFWAQDNSTAITPMFTDGATITSYALDKSILVEASTTDATPTNVDSYSVSGVGVMLMETKILAKDQASDNSAAYIRRARIRVSGGVASVENLQTEYTSEDDFAWDASITASGGTVYVQVTGAAATNIDWKTITKVEVM